MRSGSMSLMRKTFSSNEIPSKLSLLKDSSSTLPEPLPMIFTRKDVDVAILLAP